VQLCASALEGLLSIPGFQPTLIVLDVHKSGLDGIEVCKRLKTMRHTRHIPVAITSSHLTRSIATSAEEAGALPCFPKPIDVRALLERFLEPLPMTNAGGTRRLRRSRRGHATLRKVSKTRFPKVTEEMWRSMSNLQLSKLLGCDDGTVQRRRPKHIPSPGRVLGLVDFSKVTEEMWQSMNNVELAKQLRCDYTTIRRHRPKHIPGPLPATVDFSPITIKMWRSMSNRQIAELLGCSVHQVSYHRPTEIPAGGIKFDFSKVTERMWRLWPDVKIAKRLGCANRTVGRHRPKHIPSPAISVG
jgi:CheY-like chemotaxis protein